MYQRSVPHHTTGGFTSHRSFLSDEAYGSALDCLVKACSDMLLVSLDGKVFLGKRRVHPQPDWWFVGGRIFPGETPIASCQRLLRRELGLEIEASRFSAVCAQVGRFTHQTQLYFTDRRVSIEASLWAYALVRTVQSDLHCVAGGECRRMFEHLLLPHAAVAASDQADTATSADPEGSARFILGAVEQRVSTPGPQLAPLAVLSLA